MKDLTLTADVLLSAYASGVFPMAESRDSDEIFWVDPTERGVIPLHGFHISRSLARRLRRGNFSVTLDRDFAAVVAACANREETWINAQIHDLYLDLHAAGWAHSLEVRDEAGVLTGGVYGVAIGAAFFGESMFSHGRDASKIALAFLVDRLRQTGFTLFDTQFLTPHLASLGGVEIPRAEYRLALRRALGGRGDLLAATPLATPQEALQRNTQTS